MEREMPIGEGRAAAAERARSVESGTSVRITSWIVSQQNCMHGESNLFATPDPESVAAVQTGLAGRAASSSTRALEAVTVISRDGDNLSVETTESLPNGTTRTTSAGYRAAE